MNDSIYHPYDELGLRPRGRRSFTTRSCARLGDISGDEGFWKMTPTLVWRQRAAGIKDEAETSLAHTSRLWPPQVTERTESLSDATQQKSWDTSRVSLHGALYLDIRCKYVLLVLGWVFYVSVIWGKKKLARWMKRIIPRSLSMYPGDQLNLFTLRSVKYYVHSAPICIDVGQIWGKTALSKAFFFWWVNSSLLNAGPTTLPWSRRAFWSWLLSWSATWLRVERSKVSTTSKTRTDWPLTTSPSREPRVCCCGPCWRRCRKMRRADPVREKSFCSRQGATFKPKSFFNVSIWNFIDKYGQRFLGML